ncbi:MAG: hypothetical protein EXR48_07300 [Dehalococcoidia bacterium]|nr:hypothetical protein [Dehalococcoidia bacterium]
MDANPQVRDACIKPFRNAAQRRQSAVIDNLEQRFVSARPPPLPAPAVAQRQQAPPSEPKPYTTQSSL